MSPGGGGQPLRLRFDRVALRVVEAVRGGLSGIVPDDLRVLFTVSAPIRLPARTAAAIVETTKAMLAAGTCRQAYSGDIHGNRVQISIASGVPTHGTKVVGLVHGGCVPPETLRDWAQAAADSSGDLGSFLPGQEKAG